MLEFGNVKNTFGENTYRPSSSYFRLFFLEMTGNRRKIVQG